MPVTLINTWQTIKTHLDWYGFKLAIGTTLAWDPPGVFIALGALALLNWFEGAWYFGAGGPFRKENELKKKRNKQQSTQNFSHADKREVNTNSTKNSVVSL